MNFDTYERIHHDVNKWIEAETIELTKLGVRVLEALELTHPRESNIVYLAPQAFRWFCEEQKPRTVFVHRGKYDIDTQIRSSMEEACEEDEDPTPLIHAFHTEHAELVHEAIAHCPSHFYAELVIMHHGGFVTTGVLSALFEELDTALEEFTDTIENRREGAILAQLGRDTAVLADLDEPPRIRWRLLLLREWSHEQVHEVFP